MNDFVRPPVPVTYVLLASRRDALKAIHLLSDTLGSRGNVALFSNEGFERSASGHSLETINAAGSWGAVAGAILAVAVVLLFPNSTLFLHLPLASAAITSFIAGLSCGGFLAACIALCVSQVKAALKARRCGQGASILQVSGIRDHEVREALVNLGGMEILRT